MCWICDHPGATERDYTEHMRQLIGTFGWAVQGVERDGIHPPWAYTVGLTVHRRPELVITGMGLTRATGVLNGVAAHVLHADAPEPGTQAALLDGPLVEVIKVAAPWAHLNVAVEFYGSRIRALQLVHADQRGRWPWDRQYQGVRGGQPVLGAGNPRNAADGSASLVQVQADQPLSEHARRAERAYGAAADHYDLAALSFWDRYGAATIARLPLAAGDAVLDLCCGTGASAIPAARAVGPSGRVIGVDLAEPMLALARARAGREGLANIEFRRGDATRTGFPAGGFDAVVCVFGVFFAPDMTAFTAEMWRLVRPGGALAITTWGPGLFEPANAHFWDCVREVEPALYKAFNPWDEITTPGSLTELFSRAGVPGATAEAVAGRHRLDQPDRFWDVVLGSGYRATVDALRPDQQDQLRERLLRRLGADGITTLHTDVVFGTAGRPG